MMRLAWRVLGYGCLAAAIGVLVAPWAHEAFAGRMLSFGALADAVWQAVPATWQPSLPPWLDPPLGVHTVLRALPAWFVLGLAGLLLLGLGWPKPSTADVSRRLPAMPQKPLLGADDRQFLPAAVEILETPPSPITVGLIWLIIVGATAVILWLNIGRLDIHAVAPGKIKPIGSSKIVQSAEPGRVRAILVADGDLVQAGDTLIEFDPTEAAADRQAVSQDLNAFKAEILRRRVAMAAARSSEAPVPRSEAALKDWSTAQERESGVLEAELQQLVSTRDSLRSQIVERQASLVRLQASIRARAGLLKTLKERVDTRNTLSKENFGTRAAVVDALQSYQTEQMQDAAERGQLTEVEASIGSLSKRITEVESQFVAEQANRLADAERRRDQLEQELVKANSRTERSHLTAPISGTVQQLAVTTIGQVVSPGQPLATIVPSNGEIEVEAMVGNSDIGFVVAGQAAGVKVQAFPFTRYGSIEGTVKRVSSDAVMLESASAANDAVSMLRGASGNSGNFVFPAVVSLSQRDIAVDGKRIPLSPGMAVTVEIKTGERRVIDYLLSPLTQIASEAGRER